MKFSIIMPVYQVEAFIEKSITSILNQTYSDYEVFIVDDGTKDRSIELAQQLIDHDERFKVLHKKNGGLSDARNYALPYVSGDYILFLDSDDYWENELLQKLYDEAMQYPDLDLIRYQVQCVTTQGEYISKFEGAVFSHLATSQAVQKILSSQAIEPAWMYAYRTPFFLENKFLYPKGKIHEDFGCTPYVLANATYISSIPYIGLNYVQREGSIMNSDSYEKRMQKAEDVFYHYKNMRACIVAKNNLSDELRQTMFSYLANVVIEKYHNLNKEQKKQFAKKIKQAHVVSDLKQDSIKRLLKKYYYMFVFH